MISVLVVSFMITKLLLIMHDFLDFMMGYIHEKISVGHPVGCFFDVDGVFKRCFLPKILILSFLLSF